MDDTDPDKLDAVRERLEAEQARRLAERIEGVADVRAEQVADGHRIEESPGIDVAIEPGLERGVVHRVPPQSRAFGHGSISLHRGRVPRPPDEGECRDDR